MNVPPIRDGVDASLPNDRERDAASEPVLSFENVSIGFDKGNVLDGLSFSVAPRETKILIGESGSGKTLILKLAAGMIQPDSGTVQMLGHDLGQMSEKELLAFPKKHRLRFSGRRAV